ncbi:MAG TPA: hypothetical protein VM285_01810, partial [Polyangia bacterium]|nr:hypothetical protein [Polyangia bacterium]
MERSLYTWGLMSSDVCGMCVFGTSESAKAAYAGSITSIVAAADRHNYLFARVTWPDLPWGWPGQGAYWFTLTYGYRLAGSDYIIGSQRLGTSMFRDADDWAASVSLLLTIDDGGHTNDGAYGVPTALCQLLVRFYNTQWQTGLLETHLALSYRKELVKTFALPDMSAMGNTCGFGLANASALPAGTDPILVLQVGFGYGKYFDDAGEPVIVGAGEYPVYLISTTTGKPIPTTLPTWSVA